MLAFTDITPLVCKLGRFFKRKKDARLCPDCGHEVWRHRGESVFGKCSVIVETNYPRTRGGVPRRPYRDSCGCLNRISELTLYHREQESWNA